MMLKKLKRSLVPVLAGALLSGTVFADAFEGLSMMRMGAWEVDFSGNVNAFFTNGECDSKSDGPIAHGWACGSGGQDKDFGDVRDGLLPSWFNFSAATTTDNGIRTAVHLSFQPGTDTGSGFTQSLDGALGQGSTNFRQVFLTFGNESMGTIKLGRDLGVFGSDAILQDMTLLGVGSGAQGRGHTTLGRIGVGYLYADWKAQVQYASPKFNGFSFTAALVDPWGAGSLAGAEYSLRDFVDPDTSEGIQTGKRTRTVSKPRSTTTWRSRVARLISGASYIRQDVEFDHTSTCSDQTAPCHFHPRQPVTLSPQFWGSSLALSITMRRQTASTSAPKSRSAVLTSSATTTMAKASARHRSCSTASMRPVRNATRTAITCSCVTVRRPAPCSVRVSAKALSTRQLTTQHNVAVTGVV